jgi:uncharacterized membrane protein
MKRLPYYFIQGLLYTSPVAITFYFLWTVLSFLDDLIPSNIPGIGLLTLIVVITFIGFIGGFTLKFRFIKFLDEMLKTMPLIKIIYSSVSDVMKSLTGKKKGFQQPVLLRLSLKEEVRRVGFITDESLKDIGNLNNALITVYVPHSLAISGQVFIVPKDYVEPLDASSTEIMKYIIAGGVTGGK